MVLDRVRGVRVVRVDVAVAVHHADVGAERVGEAGVQRRPLAPVDGVDDQGDLVGAAVGMVLLAPVFVAIDV